MSTAVAPPPRHALGLPAGSVRAILSFGVVGLLWGVLLVTPAEQRLPLVFFYLMVLMVLVLACFFAAHGKSIGQHTSKASPLWLPSRTVRFLLLAAYLGLVSHLWHSGREFETPPTSDFAFLSIVLMTGFFIGHIVHGFVVLVRRGNVPVWFQDIQAWISLLALIGLAVVAMVHLLINPRLSESLQIEVPTLEALLAGVVALYFGARA